MSAKRASDTCSIPHCDQPVKCCGLCSACYSGVRRLQSMRLPQIDNYLWRIKRLNSRALSIATKRRRAA